MRTKENQIKYNEKYDEKIWQRLVESVRWERDVEDLHVGTYLN